MKKYLERASYTWSEDSIRLINTPSQAVRQKFFYVQEVGYFKTFPPYFTERENLDSYLILYCLSGKGSLTYQGQKYMIQPCQAFYINCMGHHYYSCSDIGWEFLWLHFNGKTAGGYYDEFVKNAFSPVTFQDTFFIESTMRRILSLTQKKDLHSEILSSNLIVNLLTQLIILNNEDSLSLSVMPDYIKTCLKEMEKHFLEPFSLDELSSAIGISKYHLSREFKKYIGTTLNEYVITLRLTYAKELLRYSQDPVSDIAYTCGFNQVSHFINLFKNREGMTPLQYRKEWNSS